ncbi:MULTISPECIES: hypothetical protein [unclassified Streptomyces]|uniref:hypothetical protein n=1 Tax=unclassified Streptomyces TaxID=2593676 RepID=UPI00368B10EC
MRRIITTAVAALLAAGILTGCSSGPSADDKKYAAAVAAADPDDFGGIATDKLAETLGSEGSELCDQLKKHGHSHAILYARTRFNEKESSALVAAAVVVYCPDQKAKIPSR